MPTTLPRTSSQHGFSLLELLITVVVIGILAGVAYPSFYGSIKKSRRSEAFTALSAIQHAEERWRSSKPSYASDLTSSSDGLGLSATTPNGYYGLALENVGNSGYDAVATAKSGTSQERDGNCAKLGVRLSGGNVLYASSSSSGTLSYAATDPCWSR